MKMKGAGLPGRIVFMGTPDFAAASLARLLTEGARPVAAFAQPDKPAGRGRGLSAPPVKALASREGIPVHQPPTLKDPAVKELIETLCPEVIVVVAYGKILPQAILDVPPLGCVNVHASLLPRHRGASPIAHAIWEGDEVTGVTTMRMEAGMDTGPLYLQTEIPVPPGATTGSLSSLLARAGGDLLVETLARLYAGKLEARPQDESRATYAPKIRSEQGRLSFEAPAEKIERQIRAFQPWPGTYVECREERVKVLASAIGGEVRGAAPGEVVECSPLGVACGDGRVLYLTRLQREGKRALPSQEVLRGFPIPRGTRL
jgi:methionyl-tRNA formyltransferase